MPKEKRTFGSGWGALLSGLFLAAAFLAQVRAMSAASRDDAADGGRSVRRASTTYQAEVAQMMNAVTAADVELYTRQLSGETMLTVGGETYELQTRHTASADIVTATQYVYEFMQARGLAVSYFDWENAAAALSGRNVVGVITGSTRPDEIVLVVAHLDDMPETGRAPGADDDASGSVGVMVAAERLAAAYQAGLRFERTVRFIALTGEEQGQLGSDAYAAQSQASGENLVAVFNMDMIGWDANNDGVVALETRFVTNTAGYASDLVIADAFTQVVSLYGLGGALFPKVDPVSDPNVDSRAFWDLGYPSVTLIEDFGGAETNPNYHTADDLVSSLNLPFYTNNVKAMVGAVAHLALPVTAGTPTETPTADPADPTETPTADPADPTETPTVDPADPTETPTVDPADPTETPTADPTETPDPADPTATPDPSDPTATPDPSDPTATPEPTETPTAVASLNESFESGALPAGWNVTGSAAGWTFDNPGERDNETGGADKFAIADSDNAGGEEMDSALETPLLNFAGKSSVVLKFQTYFYAYDTSTADVDVSRDGGQTWTNVWHQTEVDFDGPVSVNISALAGNQPDVKIRFRYFQAANAWYWQLDDVQIEMLTPLATPSDLTAAADAYDIGLSWTNVTTNETGFKVERAVAGANPAWAVVAKLDANTTVYTSTNLICNTEYNFRVQAVNAAAASGYSNVAAATTAACSSVNAIDQTFPLSASAPADWTVQKTQGALGWAFDDPGARGNLTGGSGPFAIADSGQEGGWLETELRLPIVNFAGQEAVQLTFKTALKINDETNATVAEVDVSKDGGVTWVNAWRKSADFIGPVTLDLSAQAGNQSNVQVRFAYKAENEHYWQIDDVQLAPAAAPAAATHLTATLAAAGGVNLSWRANGATKFKVERSPEGCAAWAQIADVTTGVAGYADASAAGQTAYCYRVLAYNAAETAAPSNVATVTTGDSSVVGIDVTISLYPTATAATADDRAKYEAIIKYFADGIYEVSNGANKLRRVTFYLGGGKANTAHVIWVPDCWPNAHTSGYQNGGRVEMCDVFQGQNYLTDDYLAQSGGYGSLVHEWGHYYYGLYDEYQNADGDPNQPSSPHPDDVPPDASAMYTSDPAADTADRPGDLRALNFTSAANYSAKTAQGRVFDASGWDTLARPPAEDPRTDEAANRFYHPELAAVAPKPGQRAAIDLTSADARTAARSLLQVVWVPSGDAGAAALGAQAAAAPSLRQFVIDRSGSFSVTGHLADVQAAVAREIDQAKAGEVIGLIAYADTAAVVQPLTVIVSQTTKDALKAALAGIVGGGAGAAPGDALQLALDGALAYGAPAETAQMVYLLTGGANTTGAFPLAVVPAYAENYIQLQAIGYGAEPADADSLREWTDQTGGAYHSVSDENELREALSAAGEAASTETRVGLRSGGQEIAAGQTYTQPVVVDSSLTSLEVSASFGGAPEALALSLLDPGGQPAALDCATDGDDADQTTDCQATVSNPAAGVWTLQAQSVPTATEPPFLSYWADGLVTDGSSTYLLDLRARGDAEVTTYPQPIVVEAVLRQLNPIAGAVVTGTVEDPEGNSDFITLRDDGLAPDREANDGLYAGFVSYWSDGEYGVTVRFSNEAGKAVATARSLMTTRSIPDKPIAENFARYAELTVAVRGWQDDDHANFADDAERPATPLTLGNKALSGRIDAAEDIDVFVVTVSASYSGALGVRVDRLGQGMNPKLIVYAADRSWEFARELITGTTSLFVPVTARPGETFFVEVWHADEAAAQGSYEISAGRLLASDPVARARSKPAPTRKVVYLPMIR